MYQCRYGDPNPFSRSHCCHGDAVEQRGLERPVDRYGELARGAELLDALFELAILPAVLRRSPRWPAQILLPAAVQKQTLLRREAEMALVQLAVLASRPSSSNSSRTSADFLLGTGT